MSARSKRAIIEGLGSGMVAGSIFVVAAIAVAVIAGDSATSPLRTLASAVLGRSAFAATTATMGVMIVGLIVHETISAIFGLVYAFVDTGLSPRTQTRWASQVGLGIAFGVVLWIVNFQLAARIWYPWLLDQPQLRELALYALCFGLPLAVICTGLERHARRLARAG